MVIVDTSSNNAGVSDALCRPCSFVRTRCVHTASRRFIDMVDVVGWNGSAALVLLCRVNPTAAVDAVEVEGEACVVLLTQCHATVSCHSVADQVSADDSRARISEPVDWQTFIQQDNVLVHKQNCSEATSTVFLPHWDMGERAVAPPPYGCFAPKRPTCNFSTHSFSITSVIRRPNVSYYLITTMLIYSVTETMDIASRLQQYIVVLEICLPPQTLKLPPKLTIMATCLYIISLYPLTETFYQRIH